MWMIIQHIYIYIIVREDPYSLIYVDDIWLDKKLIRIQIPDDYGPLKCYILRLLHLIFRFQSDVSAGYAC